MAGRLEADAFTVAPIPTAIALIKIRMCFAIFDVEIDVPL
jgi:hypothetical protein